MKPTEWTPLERVRFFELLMNDEYVLSPALQEEFFTIKDFMEKEMPEVLEGYAEDLWFKRLWDTNMQMIMAFLDLRNLVQYLKEHTEAPFMWGFTPCPSFPSCMSGETDKCDFPDKGCEGDGKVRGHIHPALKYLREVKG